MPPWSQAPAAGTSLSKCIGLSIRSRPNCGEPRTFRKLETAVAFMQDVGLGQFRVDARGYDRQAQRGTRRRPDAAAALRRAHEAKAHDTWFRQQVEIAVAEADDSAAVWVDHAAVKDDMRRQREALRARIAKADAR